MITKPRSSPGVTRRAALAASVALGSSPWLSRFARAAGPQRGGVLKVSQYANPSSLDPTTGRSGADHPMLWPMFDTLVDFDFATLDPKPGLAKSWEYRDPTTLVLNIRKDVLFHDGTACDAEAVKANFDYMLTNPRSTVKADVASIKSADVEAPLRVVLHLKEPDTSLPLVLTDRAGMMSSPAAFKVLGADYDRKPVGAGAYAFVQWDDADKLVLKRNERYWREGLPYLDGIEFKVMTDSNTGLRAVLAGQNDFVYRVSPQQAPLIKRSPSFGFVTNPTLYVQMIYLNASRPPLDNKLIRQALNWAIDREAYTKVVTAGMGETAGTILPKRHWAYDAQAAATYSYDQDRARKLMADAGFGAGLQLHSNHYSDQLSQQRMEILGAQLGKIGISIKSTVAAVAQANQQWHDGVGDIHLSAWTGRADPSVTYASLFAPEGYYNSGGVDHSAELTRAIRDSRSSSDIAVRKEAFVRAQRLERELALCVPLAFESEVVVYGPKVKGYSSNLIGKPRFDGVYLES